MAAAAAAPPPAARLPWRRRLMAWWLHSAFQRLPVRLAVQAGVCTLVVMLIFSAPPIWHLHTLDPVLANPVLVLVLAVLGLLFQANTGLPVLKIGCESVAGALAGGAVTFGSVYLTQAICGGNDTSVLRAAMYMLLGSAALLLGTAARFRWPQHIALAGILYNLTVAVGCAVVYHMRSRLWRFVVYWWWFVGLAFVFMVAAGLLVLPIPAGWTVRKQLARALRQEGAVLEAIMDLLTAEEASSGAASSGGGSAGGGEAAPGGALRGAPGEGQDEEGERDFPAPEARPSAEAALSAALGRAWRRLAHRSGAALSRVSSSLSLRGGRAVSARAAADAAALGILPELQPAVEPILRMSGAASASMQAARAHMRFTSLELDLYRRQRRFPALPFQRLLLLARTLLSAGMMVLIALQSGSAKLGASREHAAHLQRTAGEVKRCCQRLAAVLRSNAPVGPAIAQLAQLEGAFLELQRAVGGGGAAAAAAQAAAKQAGSAEAAPAFLLRRSDSAAAADAAANGGVPGGGEPGSASDMPAHAAAGHALTASLAAARGASSRDLLGAGATSTQDSLALHLSVSMLFTCCTRVRSMFQLLPGLVGADQAGVGDAVAAHFAAAHAWEEVLHARACSPHGAEEVFRRSQLLWDGGARSSRLRASRSAAALEKLAAPALQAAEPVPVPAPPTRLRFAGWTQRGFAAAERWTGFSRNQLALGLQIAAAYTAAMFLVVVPAVHAALAQRSVWAVFIIVVVHEPLLGSVIWKSVLRFGGTVVAGVLGLGALYFAVLCNGLSYENEPPKFIAMTAAMTQLTMPLAAGTAYYGTRNAYFFIVSCLIIYTVALPHYADDHPAPVLALWRLVCTAIGLAIELLAALLVFPVTARSAAHAAAAGALRGMAEVADAAFHSVLPAQQDAPAAAASAAASAAAQQAAAAEHRAADEAETAVMAEMAEGGGPAVFESDVQHQRSGAGSTGSPRLPASPLSAAKQLQQQQQQAPHVAIPCSTGGWHGNEVATGAVLRRIHRPMMEAYGRITTLAALLVPLRVEYHPRKTPARFPIAAGRRAQRLCRRMLNVLTVFALTMDSHHTESVPLLAPHAAELQALMQQLREALQGLAAMVGGTVALESAARAVAALEDHAQHLLLRVLLSGPPEGLSTTDATQGLAFLAILFNVTAVARLLCVALGEAFCAGDAAGQAAASALLQGGSRWAADDKLMAVAAELVSEALTTEE